MTVLNCAQEISREIGGLLAELDPGVLDDVCQTIADADRIFLCGEGRSGLVMRMFAVRLVHLGMTAYVVGEPTTPPVVPGDLLIVCSGSGNTAVPCLVAEQALAIGAGLLLFTADATSRLARIAEIQLVLDAPPKGNRTRAESRQANGSLFEQSVLLICDACFELLREARGLDAAALRKLHANLE